MNNIPVLHVTGQSLAQAYEAALVKLYNEGTRFKTQYDKQDDPLSLDCTMNITILEPESDPMIHQAKEMLFDRINEMPFENRIFNFHDDFIRQMYEEAEPKIIEKIKRYDKNH